MLSGLYKAFTYFCLNKWNGKINFFMETKTNLNFVKIKQTKTIHHQTSIEIKPLVHNSVKTVWPVLLTIQQTGQHSSTVGHKNDKHSFYTLQCTIYSLTASTLHPLLSGIVWAKSSPHGWFYGVILVKTD